MYVKSSLEHLSQHFLIILCITLVVGFLFGFFPQFFSVADSPNSLGSVTLVAVFLSTFCISVVRKITWLHFTLLFILLSLVGFLNVLIGMTSSSDALFGSIGVVIVGACAKLLAQFYLFLRATHAKGKSIGKAVALFVLATTFVSGCLFYGLFHWANNGDTSSTFKTLCAENSGIACTQLGFNYATGNGVEKDFERAHQLYKKGCELGHARGCNNLSYSFENGIGVEKNQFEAFKASQKGCNGGYEGACFGMAVHYLNGNGTDQNIPLAKEVFVEQCQKELPYACNALGILYYHGLGFPTDLDEAHRLFSWACEKKSLEACQNLESFDRK